MNLFQCGILLSVFSLCVLAYHTQLEEIPDNRPNTTYGESIHIVKIALVNGSLPLSVCYEVLNIKAVIYFAKVVCRELVNNTLSSVFPVPAQSPRGQLQPGLRLLGLACSGGEQQLSQCEGRPGPPQHCPQRLALRCATECGGDRTLLPLQWLLLQFAQRLPCGDDFCEWRLRVASTPEERMGPAPKLHLRFPGHETAAEDAAGRNLQLQWRETAGDRWLHSRLHGHPLGSISRLELLARDLNLRLWSERCVAGADSAPGAALIMRVRAEPAAAGPGAGSGPRVFFLVLAGCALMATAFLLLSCLCCRARQQRRRQELELDSVQSSESGRKCCCGSCARLLPRNRSRRAGGPPADGQFAEYFLKLPDGPLTAQARGSGERSASFAVCDGAGGPQGQELALLAAPGLPAELHEASLEQLLSRFNSLALVFHWSDRSSSTELSADTLEPAVCPQKGERWGSPLSELLLSAGSVSSASLVSVASTERSFHSVTLPRPPAPSPATPACAADCGTPLQAVANGSAHSAL